LKILNPLGYKIMSPVALRRCNVIKKGKVLADATRGPGDIVLPEHIWWLFNGTNKQYIAGYFSEKVTSW
jgi:hypothetical protein